MLLRPVLVFLFACVALSAAARSLPALAQTPGWVDAPPAGATGHPACPAAGQWLLLYWGGGATSIDRAATTCAEADRVWSHRGGRWSGFDAGAPQASDTWTMETGEAAFLHAPCLSQGTLARLWPPAGAVSYLAPDASPAETDVAGISFSQVQVLATACGRVRGARDTYVAFSAPVADAPEGRLLALAAVHWNENRLVTVGSLPGGIAPYRLSLQDLTGDGRDEIIWSSGGGATFTHWGVWSWQGDAYTEVFRQTSYLTPARFQDFDGDGTTEIVTYSRYPDLILGSQWPTVSTWDGTMFTAVLVPAVYDEFIERAKAALAAGDVRGHPESAIALHTALGRAYQLQGRTSEAIAEYRAAWQIVPAAAPAPACADATDAVARYYAALNSGELVRAYQMLSVAQPFWEWAPAFAPVTSVRLLETQRPANQHADVTTIAASITATALSRTGEKEQRVSGVWQVSRLGQACLLGPWQPAALSGAITP